MHQRANQQELCYQTAKSQISQTIVLFSAFCLTVAFLATSGINLLVLTFVMQHKLLAGIDDGSFSRLEAKNTKDRVLDYFLNSSSWLLCAGELSGEDCFLHVCEIQML